MRYHAKYTIEGWDGDTGEAQVWFVYKDGIAVEQFSNREDAKRWVRNRRVFREQRKKFWAQRIVTGGQRA